MQRKSRFRFKDGLIGYRFSKLVVIADAERDKNNVLRWLCKCDCGNEKIVYQQSLVRGATKSCGCYNREATSKRMSQGYAKIFTEEFLRKQHLEEKLSIREIARQFNCSPSCVERYMEKFNIPANDLFYDIIGKRFEKLVVLSMAYTKDGKSYWNVKCDCGVEKIVTGVSLVKRQTMSCGCHNRNKNYQGCGNLSQTYWNKIVKGAIKRKLEFMVTIQYGWNVFEQQKGICTLSGRQLVMDRGYGARSRRFNCIQTASLDRIDSTKGYIEGNIQWVHVKLNRMKWDYSEEEFFQLCREVTEYQK